MRKVLIIGVIPLVLLVLAASSASRQAPAGDSSSADRLFESRRFAEAVPLYQSILGHQPRGKDAVSQQANLIICQFCLKDVNAAQVGVERFKTLYAREPSFRQAACRIGDNLRWRNINSDKARELYALAAAGDMYPEMLWARMGLAISCVRVKDYETATAMVESLKRDFVDDSRVGLALCQTGDAYRERFRYEDAVRLYQHVIDHLPQDEYAVWSQAGLVISSIACNDRFGAATTAIERLKKGCAGRKGYAPALCAVADNYRWRHQHGRAQELYLSALAADPNESGNIWRPAGLAISSIGANDPNTAYAALATLTAQYQTDPALARALYEVGGAFDDAGLYGEGARMYEKIFDLGSSRKEDTLWAEAGQARLLAASGDDAGVEQAVGSLIGRFRDDPNLSVALFAIAAQYSNLGGKEFKASLNAAKNAKGFISMDQWPSLTAGMDHNFTNTKIILKRIVDELPPSEMTPQAIFWIGESCRTLQQTDEAIDAYQTVVDQWPDYEYLNVAKSRIAKIRRGGR
jgi:tetratricopeptide (TPR) repeat protein